YIIPTNNVVCMFFFSLRGQVDQRSFAGSFFWSGYVFLWALPSIVPMIVSKSVFTITVLYWSSRGDGCKNVSVAMMTSILFIISEL
ncbi:hypothetical protein L9F63_015274, partial [Diploptera punctata]